jgi:hypothetical protein
LVRGTLVPVLTTVVRTEQGLAVVLPDEIADRLGWSAGYGLYVDIVQTAEGASLACAGTLLGVDEIAKLLRPSAAR